MEAWKKRLRRGVGPRVDLFLHEFPSIGFGRRFRLVIIPSVREEDGRVREWYRITAVDFFKGAGRSECSRHGRAQGGGEARGGGKTAHTGPILAACPRLSVCPQDRKAPWAPN